MKDNCKGSMYFYSSIKSLFVLVNLLSCLYVNSAIFENTNPWEKWDTVTIARANTAYASDYMTEQEKLVILFTNLARSDGPLFTDTFFKNYMENRESDRYSRSLARDLKRVKDLQPLVPEYDLYQVAEGHAVASGKSGHAGHKDFDKRFKPLLGKYNLVGENCAYGLEYAIDIVIQLLIDKDVRDLGHRKNMLNPLYNSTGVSIQPHKRFGYNCVISYGQIVYKTN